MMTWGGFWELVKSQIDSNNLAITYENIADVFLCLKYEFVFKGGEWSGGFWGVVKKSSRHQLISN